MKRFALALAWAFCMALPASAQQDYLSSEGLLSDESFYKMVSCGAPADKACTKPFVHWPPNVAQNLTIGITRIDPTFPSTNTFLAKQGLDAAVSEINGLDANLTLRRDDSAPVIEVMLLNIARKSVLTDTGINGLDGNWIDSAYVHIWWNTNRQLVKGVIIITPHIERKGIASVVLEEVVQSLGLLTDIDNPDYKGRSIFDQHTNAVTRLTGQDAMAIRRHYQN